MKATLEFDLNDDSDRGSHTRAVKADNAYGALYEISNDMFRQFRKYGLPENLKDLDKEELICKLEDLFHEILIENNINLMDEYR